MFWNAQESPSQVLCMQSYGYATNTSQVKGRGKHVLADKVLVGHTQACQKPSSTLDLGGSAIELYSCCCSCRGRFLAHLKGSAMMPGLTAGIILTVCCCCRTPVMPLGEASFDAAGSVFAPAPAGAVALSVWLFLSFHRLAIHEVLATAGLSTAGLPLATAKERLQAGMRTNSKIRITEHMLANTQKRGTVKRGDHFSTVLLH